MKFFASAAVLAVAVFSSSVVAEPKMAKAPAYTCDANTCFTPGDPNCMSKYEGHQFCKEHYSGTYQYQTCQRCVRRACNRFDCNTIDWGCTTGQCVMLDPNCDDPSS